MKLCLRWQGVPQATVLLLLFGQSCGFMSHSLHYFYTVVSEPSPELPRFMAVGYVDGQRFFHYDSNERKVMPGAAWMDKVGQEDPHYWTRQKRDMEGAEAIFRESLAILRNRHNQSGGFHTLQIMYGCELSEDKPCGGRFQHGYDGQDFIAFDKTTQSWTAADASAEITKRKWDELPDDIAHTVDYLEEECPEWLRKYLDYGRETLQKKVSPVVKVTAKEEKDRQDDLVTLLCQIHGFYPREIDVSWKKDGEVRLENTFRGVVSPNPDGTYYTWLSIEVDPMEKSHYQCHVEHDGLQEPLDVSVEETAVPVWLIAVGVVSMIVLVMVVAGINLYIKQRPKKAACKMESNKDSADSLIS